MENKKVVQGANEERMEPEIKAFVRSLVKYIVRITNISKKVSHYIKK